MMKGPTAIVPVLVLSCPQCYAVPIGLFTDTDTFIKRAKDIVIAKCLSLPENGKAIDGLLPVDVEVLMVLKGTKKPGMLKVATIYPVTAGTTYMLANSGGSALGTDFLALPELSVVPIPRHFDVNRLRGKPAKEQVHQVFSRRLFRLERELAPLLKEQSLLQKGLRNRTDNLYESASGLRIKDIASAVTKDDGRSTVYLDLDGKKLLWSDSTPGESGALYFGSPGLHTPFWEFSPSKHVEIEGLQGERLRTRFYGRYTPGRTEAFHWTGPNAIEVRVGQVVLARTVDDPKTLYILQIDKQDRDKERLYVRYAVVREQTASEQQKGTQP